MGWERMDRVGLGGDEMKWDVTRWVGWDGQGGIGWGWDKVDGMGQGRMGWDRMELDAADGTEGHR